MLCATPAFPHQHLLQHTELFFRARASYPAALADPDLEVEQGAQEQADLGLSVVPTTELAHRSAHSLSRALVSSPKWSPSYLTPKVASVKVSTLAEIHKHRERDSKVAAEHVV